MEYIIKTKGNKMTLTVTVLTNSPQKIHIATLDPNKANTVFTSRAGVVDGTRKFEIPLPETSDQIKVIVFNEKNGWRQKKNDQGQVVLDNTFKVAKFGIDPLKTWKIDVSSDKKDFLDFAQSFCENAGVLLAGDNMIYESNSGKYKILYLETITNKDGKELSTPARVSAKTKIIEISKKAFLKYSVQMRMIILLHEFSHVYVNKDMRNEMQADLNALYYYLGKGYSPVEAHTAFLEVFDNADTAQNEMRYQILKKYIDDFIDGKIVEPNFTPVKQAA